MIKIGKNTITRISHRNEEEVLTPSDLPSYLNDVLELEDGVTFKRIFDLIISNRKIFDIIFASKKGFFPIDLYIKEYVKDDDDDEDDYPNKMEYLELIYIYDYWDYDGETTIESYVDFHGVCEKYKENDDDTPSAMSIGIGFTPINQLKKYVIKINNKFIIQKYDTDQKPPKLITFVEGKTTMTLFDFIGGILHEISWHGTPSDRDKRIADLEETSKRIESGEEELFEWIIDKETGKHFFKDKDGNLTPIFDDQED